MKNIKPLVFLPPFLLCAAFVILQMTNEKQFVKILTDAFNAVAGTWGWLVSLLSFSMLVLCGIISPSDALAESDVNVRRAKRNSTTPRVIIIWLMAALIHY